MEPTFYADYYRHENTHWWFRWRFDLITGIVRSLRDEADGELQILDAGCGTGQMLQHLERYGQAIGIDTAREAIHYASTRGVDRLVLASVDRLPFADGTFDCVLSLDVIEHVADDAAMVRSLYDAVKPGGHLIVTVPAFKALWSSHDEVNWHKRRYTAPELRRLVAETGLEIERLTYCNTALFAPIYLARKVKNLRERLVHNGATTSPEISDLSELPRPLNEALYRLLQAETRLMRRTDLPFGVSLLAVARKPLDATAASPVRASIVEPVAVAPEPMPVAIPEPVAEEIAVG